MTTPTPRTQAVYDEWLATKGKFGPDAHGCYQGLKIWVVMEELELESAYWKARCAAAEDKLIDIKLFGDS
jgi:hypothetical protein